jgi:hypothetical protein
MGLLRKLICMLGTLACRHRIAIQLQELKDHAWEVGKWQSRYGVELPNTVHVGSNSLN